VLAVDGPSGAGKSTLAAELVGSLTGSVVTVSTDDFATWADPVSWWPRLATGVLEPLAAGLPGAYQRMDWSGETPQLGEWVTVPVSDVLVLEGVSAGRASIRDRLTFLVWAELPDEAERLARTVARDGTADAADLARWQRFERGWFAVDGTRAAANLQIATMRW
jgi:hypothetical protein